MVFATDLDRVRHPLGSRLWGVVIGTLLMCSVCVALIGPRTIAFTLPAVGLALLASAATRRNFPAIRFGSASLAVLALACWGLLSTLWSSEPAATINSPAGLTFVAIITLTSIALLRREPRPNMYHVAEGLWIGLLVGLLYLLVELVTHQGLKIFVYNLLDIPKASLRSDAGFRWKGDTLVAISDMDLTRSISPVTLLMWPAMLALKASAPRGATGLWTLLLFGLAAAVVLISGHETSKVALLFSALVFALAGPRSLWAKRLLQVTILGACFAVMPVVLAMNKLALHESPHIQHSLQHRIAIWNHTAAATLDHPFIGIGAGMMYQLAPADEAVHKPSADGRFNLAVPHAHNVFLQTWYELGAAGAVLLAWACWAALQVIARASDPHVRFGYATFAATLVMGAASYGMWQIWFLSLFALSALSYTVALRVNGIDAVPSTD